MKLCCLSDLHGHFPNHTPECDVLVISGDIVPLNAHDPHDGALWLHTKFRTWLERLEERGIVVVGCAGNHDFVFQERTHELYDELPWIYLQDESVVVDGVKFWGHPWQPVFGKWAFNRTEGELERKLSMVESGVDVFVSHGPPYGAGDRLSDGNFAGSYALRDFIEDYRPRTVVCGHIHEGYGIHQDGGTTVVNASYVDERYWPLHNPIMIDVEKTGRTKN